MKIYRAIKDSVTFAYTNDEITYLLDYRNYGSIDAEDVVIVENVPKDFIVIDNGGGVYDASTHTITWKIGKVSGYHSDGTIGQRAILRLPLVKFLTKLELVRMRQDVIVPRLKFHVRMERVG